MGGFTGGLAGTGDVGDERGRYWRGGWGDLGRCLGRLDYFGRFAGEASNPTRTHSGAGLPVPLYIAS